MDDVSMLTKGTSARFEWPQFFRFEEQPAKFTGEGLVETFGKVNLSPRIRAAVNGEFKHSGKVR